jgi:CRP-like cAMP-binding protein
MSATPTTTDLLRRFTPLNSLRRENLAALAKQVEVFSLDPGKVLIREGDVDKRAYYLVSGTLELLDRQGGSRLLRAGTRDAASPITPVLPRRCQVRAVDRVEYLSIDTDLLDVMLTWDQTGSYEVGELRSEGAADDWMTTLLASRTFQRLPPANLQAIFMRMQQVNCLAGDVIIRQGDEGDYFYVVTRGRCVVTRETPLSRDDIKLAELGVGDTFGEEALISGARRNATVTMLTDGALMRLGKQDFARLLNDRMIDWADYDEARGIVERGGRWLDVRLPSEFEAYHEPGAINVPLYFIRLKLGTLDLRTPYVVCCDTGQRSSAAAFILIERGFTTRVLKGGLNAVVNGVTA